MDDGVTTYYQVAYTFKALTDTFHLNVALGNLGLRLESGDHVYSFRVNTTENGTIIPKRMARVIEAHLEMDLAAGKKFPPVMEKHFNKRWRCYNYVVPTTVAELDELNAVVSKYAHAEQYKVRKSLHLHKTAYVKSEQK